MSSDNKPISISFKNIVINDNLLRYYENNMSEMRAGSFDLIGNKVIIYRYSIQGKVSKDNKVAKMVAYYNAHHAQYIVYYKRLCQNYAALPVKLVGANPYSNILLKYVAEVSSIAEGFLVGNANPSESDVLEAVLKSAKVLDKQKDVFAKEHMSLDLAGVVLGAAEGKPLYDASFKKLCRQFLTFGNVCLFDLDKNSEQAKQIRKLFVDAQKYYENRFSNAVKKNKEFNEKRFKVAPMKTIKVSAQTINVIQDRKNVSEH